MKNNYTITSYYGNANAREQHFGVLFIKLTQINCLYVSAPQDSKMFQILGRKSVIFASF